MKAISLSHLALAVAAVLVSAPAVAASLAPGDSHVVKPGDATDWWDVDGATLTLNPGATASYIRAANNASILINGAQVTYGYAGERILSLEGSNADISNSSLEGGEGFWLRDSAATISNTVLKSTLGSTAAMVMTGAVGSSVGVSNGSRIVGDGRAVAMQGDGTGTVTQHRLVVDGSSLESGHGYDVIWVASDASAEIELRNGTTAKASGGTLLRTLSGGSATLTIDSSDITGSIESAGTTNVRLQNNAALTGWMRGVSSLSVESAQWNVTGNSSLDSLQLGAGGTVAFEPSTIGWHTTLTVGDFAGADGTLVFNTVLGNDASASDKLVVTGDTSGTANVRVNNIGGAGALTYKGIELISVGGASNGVFTLAGRAVGGAYEYFLHKGIGADGNWYLRSQTPTTGPEPCDLDPSGPWCDPDNPGPGPGTGPGDGDPYPMPKPEPGDEDPYPLPGVDPDYPDPENPDPIQRPEGGAYLANLQAAQQMFRTGYRDRQPGQNMGRAWVKVDGSRSRFDASSRQLDVSGNSQSLSVGANVWQHESGSSAGVMLSSGNASSTSSNDLTGYYARGKVRGEALGVYGTWRGGNAADPNAGFYVDGSLQRAQFRNRVEGVGLETERYSSDAWQGAVEAGYAFRVGGASNGGIYLEPQLQLGYSRVSVGEHTEANGTVVQAHAASGLFGRAGARLSGVTQWGDSGATVQPYVAVNWLYNGADASVRMNDELVDARIPRSRAELSGGASVDFGNGFGAWGGVSLQKASGYHQSSAQVGLSYRW